MSQIFYILFQLAVIACLSIAALVFIILAIVKRKKTGSAARFIALSAVSIIFSILIWTIDPSTRETEDRESSVQAFSSNFGFNPPEAVKEIMHKNQSVFDSHLHYMCFTYDSISFQKILAHDQPLDTALRPSRIFYSKVESAKKHTNTPDWFTCPDSKIEKIYFKENFLHHSHSEYYLWINRQTNMVYLYVTYFD
ncbi:MAG: hypothetical protein ACKOXB_09655 [Flavobacteriales bacterium]